MIIVHYRIIISKSQKGNLNFIIGIAHHPLLRLNYEE